MMVVGVFTAMCRPGFSLLISVLLAFAPLALAEPQAAHGAQSKQSAAAAFEEGQNAQERGDLSLAVKLYSNAIAAEPLLFQAYYQRAVALADLGRNAEAESDFRKVIELSPRFARAYRGLGQVLLDRGKTAEAIQEFERAREIDPKLSGVRIYQASAFIKNNDNARAAAALSEAISQGETTSLAHALMGVALERLGKTDEAFASYSRAIEIDSANAMAREGRARLFESRNQMQKAIEDYSVAYRAQPTPELALKLASVHSRAGQPQAAIQIYRGHLSRKPEDFGVRTEMVRLMAENGQAEEAAKEVEKLLAAEPSNARLLMLAGDIFYKERPEVATGYYRRATEADPRDNRARIQLGASLVRSMQYEAALPVLADALAREPDSYPAHANLATALFKLRQYPQAAREFILLVKARPETAASYFFLAISLDKIGNCEQSRRVYQEFIRRADQVGNKNEIEEATIRLGLLDKLAKDGKCKSTVKGK
jgi:tetratricopeptide (TPR) repeat protein